MKKPKFEIESEGNSNQFGVKKFPTGAGDPKPLGGDEQVKNKYEK